MGASDISEWGDLVGVFKYKFDNAENWSSLTLTPKEMSGDKKVYETGNPFALQTIDISGLELGNHTLHITFEVDGRTDGPYSATFTKVADISGATVSGVDASYDWTGSVIHPVPVVTLGETVLNSTSDYDVTYSEGCTNVGSYNVTITGKNN